MKKKIFIPIEFLDHLGHIAHDLGLSVETVVLIQMRVNPSLRRIVRQSGYHIMWGATVPQLLSEYELVYDPIANRFRSGDNFSANQASIWFFSRLVSWLELKYFFDRGIKNSRDFKCNEEGRDVSLCLYGDDSLASDTYFFTKFCLSHACRDPKNLESIAHMWLEPLINFVLVKSYFFECAVECYCVYSRK